MSGAHHQQLFVEGNSAAHRAAPHLKLLALVGFVVSVATIGPTSTAALAVSAALALAVVAVSGLKAGQVLRRMTPALPVMVAACLIPLVSSDPEATQAAGVLLTKIIIGAGASVVFAATTRPTELVLALQKLRVPKVIVGIVSFMFRYLDLMVGEVGRIRVAMTSRGYKPTRLTQAKPIASAGGAMFARSFERGERVHNAMASRGFTGTLPAVEHPQSVQSDAGRRAGWLVALSPTILVVLARVAT